MCKSRDSPTLDIFSYSGQGDFQEPLSAGLTLDYLLRIIAVVLIDETV